MAGHGQPRIEMAGRRFGRWIASARSRSKPHPCGKTITEWFCRCDCGTEAWVNGPNLRAGKTTSCGCARLDWQKQYHAIQPEVVRLIGERWVAHPPPSVKAIATEVGLNVETVRRVALYILKLPSRVGPGGIGRATVARKVGSVEVPVAGQIRVRCSTCANQFESTIAAPVPCPHCHAAPDVPPAWLARSA